MGKSFTKADNSKKVAGNAKKAEAAARKQDAENARVAAEEDAQWSKGAKNGSKKEDAAAKKADAARKKAERDAMLAAEEAGARSAPKNSKTASKKTAAVSRGTLDLGQLDSPSSSASGPAGGVVALNASGIDNALDALSLAGGSAATDASKIDRHPERRYKAAYTLYEARRLPEIEAENPGLRRQQRIELCRKEFEKSPDNPFNQVSARFDSSRDELRELAQKERERVEGLLSA